MYNSTNRHIVSLKCGHCLCAECETKNSATGRRTIPSRRTRPGPIHDGRMNRFIRNRRQPESTPDEPEPEVPQSYTAKCPFCRASYR